jgi:hypothetical protein
MGGRAPITRFPAWTATIRSIIEAQARRPEHSNVTWFCNACGAHGVPDLQRILAAKGPGYSLVNRRTRCRKKGCKGWVRFNYQSGMMRALADDATIDLWSLKDEAAKAAELAARDPEAFARNYFAREVERAGSEREWKRRNSR